MLGHWMDIDRATAEMDAFRRQMETVFDALEGRRTRGFNYVGWSAYPEATLKDEGNEFVLRADVPGMKAGDLELQVTASGLTIRGERKIVPPEGYQVHRQERGGYRFSRNFAFPVKVDADRVSADLKDGVLTVRAPKVAEVQPRRITVNG